MNDMQNLFNELKLVDDNNKFTSLGVLFVVSAGIIYADLICKSILEIIKGGKDNER